MGKLLTIGILTLEESQRQESLQRLLQTLRGQGHAEAVEILVNKDDGSKPVGQKRNEILDQASGDFICFVDDDDMVTDQYLARLLGAIRSTPTVDCIGFAGMYHIDGRRIMKFKHANCHGGNFKDAQGVQCRPVNHLNPVRTSLARQIRFPERNFAEDADYCDRLHASGLLKNEVVIEDILYLYLWSPSGTRTQQR